MNLRRLAGLAFAFTLAAPVGMVLDSGSANAVAVLQTCTLNKGTATIQPPLTTTPQNNVKITSHGTLTGCTPTNATGGSATTTSVLKLANGASCQQLAAGGGTSHGTATAKWKNGKTSTGTLTASTTKSAPTVANLSGKTTGGTLTAFVGSTTHGSVMFSAKFTGTGAPCSPTNPLKTLTYTSTYSGKTHPYKVTKP